MIKFSIIQSMSCQLSNRKILYLEDLLNGLNNKNNNYILKNLIQQFQYLNNKKFIKDEFFYYKKIIK